MNRISRYLRAAIIVIAVLIPLTYVTRKALRHLRAQQERTQQESQPVLASYDEWRTLVQELGGNPDANRTLVIVTAAWCPQCQELEHYLKQSEIPFLRADIDTTRQGAKLDKLLSARGVVGVPQAIVNNNLMRADGSLIRARMSAGASER